ncbi:MAG: CRTAC1 family protein, partial [Candidatus Glassbacteria bacterium]
MNNYIFGTGLWIGGLADLDADGIRDTVVVYGYNPLDGGTEHGEGRVGQDPADPLARVFSSTVLEDLLEWPDEFRDPIGDPIVYSFQDFVTIYNDIGGTPDFEAGRCGVEVRQRSMAFIGGLAYNTILLLFELTNRSDSLPDGPYTLEEAYIGFVSDMDIGDTFADDMTSVLDSVEVYGRGLVTLNTAVAWDSNFVESNFDRTPGFVGTFFLQPPGDAWDGLDNDGDGLVDESPFNGIDDDLDGVADDIPDEVDAVGDFHYTVMSNRFTGPPPNDPQSDTEAYRMMRCLTDEACGEWDFATDIRYLISIGPFDLPPGESQIAGVAIVFENAVGNPDHIDLYGDPPRPDPEDSVFTEFIATIQSVKTLYESGFEYDYDVFEILGTTDLDDTNDPLGPYQVYTNIIDSVPLARVTLHYSVDGSPFEESLMEHELVNLYGGDIPDQPFWSTVTYYIQAVDSAFQTLRDPEDAPITTYEFSVLDVPDFSRVPCEMCGLAWSQALSDFDTDGLIDIFMLTSKGPILYRNTGDFIFEDITSGSGIEAPATDGGACWGDYDNDGYPDLFIGSYTIDGSHLLYRNMGGGTFENVTELAGVADTVLTSGGVWGDVDGDGLLDLITTQYGMDRLYVNQGDGTLEDRAGQWGIAEDENDKAAAFLDMDGDGDQDLLLTGGVENFLYENRGEGGFVNVIEASGIDHVPWNSIAVGDYDGDGDVDLLLAGASINLYENSTGAGFFVDVTDEKGLTGLPVDASWADINADGHPDIVTSTPSVFVQRPAGTFQNLTELSGISPGEGSRNVALPFDADGDGLCDLVINDFWENGGYGGYFPNHWLKLLLLGTVSNRSTIGAVAMVYSGDTRSTGYVSGGDGRSQDSPLLYFGLDTLTVIDSLVIGWPSGITQRLGEVSVDQYLVVVEDSTLGVEGGDVGNSVLPLALS